MLQALCAQRDRFRMRAQALQEELSAANARVTSAEASAEASRAENVALIERLRYVQSFTCVPLLSSNTALHVVMPPCRCCHRMQRPLHDAGSVLWHAGPGVAQQACVAPRM
jgi:CASP C terminal